MGWWRSCGGRRCSGKGSAACWPSCWSPWAFCNMERQAIVTTQGHDVENLMIALGELTSVYEIQRWLWLVLGAIVLLALAGTVTGYAR